MKARWLFMPMLLACLPLALAGCNSNTTPSAAGSVTVSGTITLSDGTVPPAILDVYDSNNNNVAHTNNLTSSTGAYSVTLPGNGTYNFKITAFQASMQTGNTSVSGNTTLNFSLKKTASGSLDSSSSYDIGAGSKPLQPA